MEHQSDMNPLAGNDEKMSNNSNKEKTNKQLIKESNQTENKSKQEVSTFINLSDEENILVNELVESGVKVTPEKVLAIGRNGSGKIVWLEEGSAASGYKHIELRHKKEFDKAGIKNIINFVKESAINGKETKEIQGKDRPIYEVTYQGVFYRVALQIASNGYIVSMNMVSNKK